MFPADLLRCVGGGSGDARHMNDTTSPSLMMRRREVTDSQAAVFRS